MDLQKCTSKMGLRSIAFPRKKYIELKYIENIEIYSPTSFF